MKKQYFPWIMTCCFACIIWYILAHIVLSIMVTIFSSHIAKPALNAACLAGASVGIIYPLIHQYNKMQRLGFLSLMGFIITYVASSFMPLNISGGSGIMVGIMLAFFAGFCVDTALGGIKSQTIHERENIEAAIINLVHGISLLILSGIVVIPFIIMVVASLKSQSSLMLNPLNYIPDISQGFGKLVSSYNILFTEYNFGRYIVNSAFISIFTVIITLLFAIPGAWAVARLRFPWKEQISRSILLIYLVPAIVLVMPLYSVFSQLGIRGQLWALLIVYPAQTLPFAIYMLQGYFRGIPVELEEAAIVDNCPRWKTIIHVTLPLSLPALASVALYVFMIAWNEFLFAFMFLDDPNLFTLSRAVKSLDGSETPRQLLMAGSVIVTIPIMAIFLWAERFMVSGLTSGGVKG